MASAPEEDLIANKALQECSQDIVDNINVDLVILRLHSKGRLTTQDINRLENISTSQEKKRQLYIYALADKGSAAFKDFVDVLNDTGLNYKPHGDLAGKLSKHHRSLHSQHSNKQGEGQEVKTTDSVLVTKTATNDSESRCSDDGNDVDHFSDTEQCDDQSQLLPRGPADVVHGNYNLCTSHIQENQKVSASNIDMRPDHSVDIEASTSTTCTCLSSMESSRRVLKLSSSFQNSNDHMGCQTPSSVKAHGRPVIMRSRMDQSETAYSVASNVTKESGFTDSFVKSKSAMLIKSSSQFPKMISIKLILLGDSGVGKTSLARQFLHDVFYDDSPMTVGNRHDQYYFQHVQKGINIKLSVWDTAGNGQCNVVSPMYYRNAHVAIVVFDMTVLKSLLNVNNWKTQIVRQSSNKDDIKIPVLLVGNKCDIPEESNEIRRRAQGIAENFDDFIEASAKDNFNVENVFEKAISLALKNYIPCEDTGISLYQQQQQQKQSCC